MSYHVLIRSSYDHCFLQLFMKNNSKHRLHFIWDFRCIYLKLIWLLVIVEAISVILCNHDFCLSEEKMIGVGNAVLYRSKNDIDRHVQELFNKLNNEHEVCCPLVNYLISDVYIWIQQLSPIFWDLGFQLGVSMSRGSVSRQWIVPELKFKLLTSC